MKKLLISVCVLLPFLTIGQTTSENYMKTTAYQVQTVDGNVATSNKIESINYYDGLGRPKQSIAQRAGGNSQDLITPIIYDNLGRQPKDYLPYPTDNQHNNGYYLASPLTPLLGYYDANFPEDKHPFTSNPYSDKHFEDSPLSRVLEVGAPGKDWKIDPNADTDHTIKIEYKTNTSSSEVKQFRVGFNANDPQDPYLDLASYYPTSSLYKTITKDENWKPSDGINGITTEYKDKQGRVVLKRQKVLDPLSTINNDYTTDTHYVYDDYGNLTFVLSPEGSDKITNGINLISDPNRQTVLDDLCYQYKYDYRNRLIEKKIPGKGWESILYDALDRPVLTQDQNLKSDNNKWLFTKYDAFGRVAYTGIVTNPPSRAVMEQTLRTPLYVSEKRETTATTIGDTDVYYSNFAFPTLNLEVLTVNYYDDDDVDADGLSVPATVYNQDTTQDTKGLPTVSKVRVLGTAHWITSITGYDDKARPIYVASKNNFLSTTDVVKSKIDFVGKTTESETTHFRTGDTIITTKDYFTYDHMGRLKTHEQQIDNESVQLIAENFYDPLGQLIQKDVGGVTFVDGYTDILGVDVSVSGTVEKIALGSQNWDSGLKTRGQVLTEGGIEFKAVKAGAAIKAGFYETGTVVGLYDTLHYGIVLTSELNATQDAFKVQYIEMGTTAYASVDYNDGETFKVERSILTTYPTTTYKIEYSKGGLVFHTATSNVSTVPLVGKAVFKTFEGSIENFNLFGNNIDQVLQHVDYSYNIRGWLKTINDVTTPSTGTTDLFSFKLNYNTPEATAAVAPLYNGNISQTIWKTAYTDKDIRSYAYQYDQLNRIKTAASFKHANNIASLTANTNHDVSDIDYDYNGNIQSLKRKGLNGTGTTAQIWDDLSYTYDGNKLTSVTDQSTSSLKTEGFRVTPSQNQANYTYDLNGNMITDDLKDITSITYNHLNLPVKIVFDNSDPEINRTGKGIIYTYDATGVKLQKEVFDTPQPIITIQYAGNYVYQNDVTTGLIDLQFFNHPEGYVEPVAGTSKSVTEYKKGENGEGTVSQTTFSYIFQYKDHLGNVRLSYSDSDLNGAIDAATEIIEESNYFPFGLKQKGYNYVVSSNGNSLGQKFKTFQDQELTEDLGYNMHEFKYRHYDAAIGRFVTIDPLTEEYRDWGPYVFSGNRVIDARELEGLEPYIVTGRAFIPTKTLSNPLAPVSKTKSFAGDNRNSYQANSSAYRTEQKVRVDFDNNTATTLSNRANSTIGHDKNGNITERSDPGKAGPTPTYTPSTMENGSTTVGMEVDASNKLVSGAPAINYDVGITITQKEDGTFDFQMSGKADGFPAYEFFVTDEANGNSYLIHGSNPAQTGDTPTSLFPPMDKSINVSGNSGDLAPVKEVEFNTPQ